MSPSKAFDVEVAFAQKFLFTFFRRLQPDVFKGTINALTRCVPSSSTMAFSVNSVASSVSIGVHPWLFQKLRLNYVNTRLCLGPRGVLA
ncbi:MAG TPA: hypothetical protein VG826_11060 [Pirellulales bacterium]|nr:hypothetical protein [Pirellulales bacterium]